MEKLEQEMNAPEKMAETPSPKKTAGKKKKFRKNAAAFSLIGLFRNLYHNMRRIGSVDLT